MTLIQPTAGGEVAIGPELPVWGGDAVPLSFAQERLWFLHRMRPESAFYTIAVAHRLAGPLDAGALERALALVVERHETLRTTIQEVDGAPVQVIAPFRGFSLPVEPLSGPGVPEREAEMRRLAGEEARRPFDLAAGPLFRARLLRLGDDDHALLLTLHHIVGDGWSLGVLQRELSAAYAALLDGGDAALPELPIQYADFALWQRERLGGEAVEGELAWWTERLAGAPALAELPADRPRPAVLSDRGARERADLPGALVQRLQALARSEGATLNGVLLAAFQVLLAKYAGSGDVVLGIPVAGRTRWEVQELIGFFADTLVLRTDLSGDPSFREALRRTRETVLEAHEHRELPFERLVEALQPERSLGHSPLFQVMFAEAGDDGPALVLRGVEASPVEVEVGTSKFDLVLTVFPRGEGAGASLEYSADLFDPATARRILGHWTRLLEQAAADPGAPLSRLSLLDAAERERVVERWNRTASGSPQTGIVPLFEAWVDAAPEAVALDFGGATLTYAELDARANRLARRLVRLGVGLESRVGVCLERGVELIVSLLAILKAGGAYVPLDAGYPAERLERMLAGAGVSVLLTESGLRGVFRAGPGPRVVEVDREAAEVAAESGERLERAAGPGALAYVVYTSGSTGTPRAVGVEHRGVVRLVHGASYADLGPGEVILQAAPVSFDASTFEIWGALLNGGRLVPVPGSNPSLEELGTALVEHGVTTAWLTAGLFQVMAQERLEDFRGLRQLLAGGDVLPADAVARLRERFPGCRVINGYGPTENTTFTCCHTVPGEWDGGSVPVGTPVSGTRVYVLDPALGPLPVGVAGELYAGGDGVARGYLGDPARTAERFVPDPFAAEPGARMYRTGDRARWRADGVVEYLGRLDAQVKIRGFRIEPGEVEAALGRHPGVAECIVVAREDAPGDRRLVAYVVGEARPEELRDHLRRSLPEYMVPAACVVLGHLPLTPNGKVDRRALPAPDTGAQGEGDGPAAPRTPVEEVLAGVWAEVLGRDRVGVDESFFELGGHSLLAMLVMARVREVFGTALPLRVLFEDPTVAGLAARVEAGRRAGEPPLPPVVRVEDGRPLPLSFGQERLWFLHRLEPESAMYTMLAPLRLRGALGVGALERALGEMVRRHEVLRTVFAETEEGAVQAALPFAGFALPADDLSALPGEAREEEVRRRAVEERERPFDFAAAPPFRARLLRLGPAEHVLLVCMHHVVSDGWSLEIFFRELSALYAAALEGREAALPALPVRYADFAAWQREQMAGGAMERQLGWWRERLEGAPALLELPTDRPRPAAQSFRGAREHLDLPPALLERARSVARAEGATLYMVLLAAFQALLAKYAATDDVVVGTPIAGRTRREVEGVIGFFVNTLVLRTGLGGDPTFREAVRRVREVTLGAYEHPDVPFERLVAELRPERSLGHAPLFQVMFTVQDGEGSLPELPGVRAEAVAVALGTTTYDLSLTLVAHPGGLRAGMEFSTDLFDPATVRAMLAHLGRVLEQGTDEADPRLSALELLGGAERARVLEAWSGAGVERGGALVHERFAAQAERTPEAAAVVFEGRTLTYDELDQASARLAAHLRARGVGPETRVGVFAERVPETVVALLAILRAGGAFVPLDPAYPSERLRYMLSDSGARTVVAPAGLPAGIAPGLVADLLDLRAEAAEIAARPARAPAVEVDPEGLAYLVYTSGSTGRPKGVMVSHRGLPNLALSQMERFAIDAGSRVLQFASFSFDAAVSELFTALLPGATLVMAERDDLLPGAPLAETLRRERVSVATLPPSALAVTPPGDLPDLRTVVSAGEAADAALVARWSPGRRFVNAYGPTETTVCVSCGPCEADGRTPPIGRPLENVRAYVLESVSTVLPAGVPGELYVGGAGVARGYLGRPGQTAERFLPDPFAATPGARMYGTGDRVRWREGGVLEYLGRFDEQVKIRGFRVEPAEAEAALRELEGVRECAVVAREDAPGERRLVAYVVGETDAAAVRAHLRGRLPDYLVPAAVVALGRLPLTPGGKVDRKALPAPGPVSAGEGGDAPRTPVEEVLAGVWAEVLRLERVGTRESFFELGGHSLLATRVVSRVREALGVELPLRALFAAPTVAEAAERVEALRRAAPAALPPIVPVSRDGALPLSFAQERLWFLGRMEPESPFYNVPAAVRLEGALDVDALERALAEVVRRHEALRTVFREEGGAPTQEVAPAAFALARDDLSTLPEGEREAEARRRAAAEAARPFDLAEGPLFRARLLRLGEAEHHLLLCMHHVVSDGWSMGILFRELSALYAAFREGAPSPLEEPAVQYADYAAWQRERLRGEALEGELAWWRERLAGAPALLELPTDHPRPAVQRYRGARESFALPPSLLDRLQRLARGEGATLYMVLLAAFQALLAKHAATDDVVVGTPIAGRTRREVEGVIGCFVNTLVLRADLSGNPTFREAIRRVREVTLGAYEHQEAPFERLVEELHPERSTSHAPLFQVMFILQNNDPFAAAFPGVTATPVETALETTKFDLTLAFAADASGLQGTLEYSTDLFEPATAARMVAHLGRVLEQVADTPDRPLSALSLMDADERTRVVEEWNRTAAPYPAERCIHQLFEAQAARTPEAVAVVHGTRSLTFRDLDARANRLAHHLRRRGVGPESRVGICLERGIETLVALLGVLKAGGAYVPLDIAYPAERLRFMLEDSGVRLLLAQERLRARLPLPEGVEIVGMDGGWAGLDPATVPPESGVTSENLAYVIYTSGSTGRPKGVAMHHRGVCNYIDWGIRAYGAGTGNGAPVFSSLAVDLTVTNLLPLFAGLPVRMLAEEAPVEALADALREGPGFGLIKITPVHLSLLTPLITAGAARGAAQTLVVGADFLMAEPTLFWQDHAPEVRLMNEYGPTETVVGCSAYVLPNGVHRAGPVPVGGPIQNLAFHVLDAHGEPVPVGLPGELHIGGAGVARGYLGRPGLTAEKFVPDPFAGGGARMYRTGDRARWLPEGNLLILGRTDHQVKIRGYRVEPGEVEAALRRTPGVRDALVVAREDRPGDRRLVAYVVAEGEAADPAALRRALGETVPEYMVPSAFVRLDALPQTRTGKIDPKTLPAPEYGGGGEAARPRTELERSVAEAWRSVLGVAEVGVTDNFFDLGGTSLLLYRVFSALRGLRRDLRVVDLFRYPTVETLARHLGEGPADGALIDESLARAEERRASRRRVRSEG